MVAKKSSREDQYRSEALEVASGLSTSLRADKAASGSSVGGASSTATAVGISLAIQSAAANGALAPLVEAPVDSDVLLSQAAEQQLSSSDPSLSQPSVVSADGDPGADSNVAVESDTMLSAAARQATLAWMFR